MYLAAIEHVDNYRLDAVKECLARCFADLGLDEKNPLGQYVHPGDCVFIKPNWVASRWRASCPHTDSLYCVITHPAVIEAVVDFTAIALEGRGRIILGDNSSIDADFEELMEFTKMRRLEKKYEGLLTIKDLRPLVCDDLANYGKRDKMVSQDGDDAGTVQVNLGRESLFYGMDPVRFRGVFDERDETIAAHSGEQQLYTYSRSLYNADVYISIPKMKTHQKVGATLNLKGLVGSIADKNQLVHWQVGYPAIHGDEYPSKEAYEAGQKAKVKHRGAWPGNDTIWRMVVDLYQGMRKRKRRYFSVIDGIMAGEGQGPFCPTAKYANTLVAADHLLVADLVAARYMGLDPERISYLAYFLQHPVDGVALDQIGVIHGNRNMQGFFKAHTRYRDFQVVEAWREILYPL